MDLVTHPAKLDDLLFFLTVARLGSALKAAEQLGVHYATVVRRVDALEDWAGEPVYHRVRSGWTLTPFGQRLRPLAERVEREWGQLCREVLDVERQLAGTVRILTVEGFARGTIPPVLPRFRLQYPELRLSLNLDGRLDRLIAREVDLAIWPAAPRELEGIERHLLGTTGFGVYAARTALQSRPQPQDLGALSRWDFLDVTEEWSVAPSARWRQAALPDSTVVAHANDFECIRQMVLAGVGAAVLPAMLCQDDPRLARIWGPIRELALPVEILVPEELARVPRIEAVVGFMTGAVREASHIDAA